MVDGTGLENQQINVSQVRILSLPPKWIKSKERRSLSSRLKDNKNPEFALVFLLSSGYVRSEASLLF